MSEPAHDLIKLKAAYDTCFQGDSGERVIKDLEKNCFANTPSHMHGDPFTTAYNEGRRSVLLMIKSMLTKTVNDIELGVKEAQGEEYV